MAKNNNFFHWSNLVIGFISALAGVAGFAYAVQSGWVPLQFSGKNDRFSCQLLPDTSRGGQVWTVVYHNDKGQQPWLRMVHSFGEDWNTPKRCETITDRLEGFRKDGLIAFSHRSDPTTPRQSVICAKTKLSPDNCELVVTLVPDANGYESLRAMTEALRTGTTVDQGSNGGSASFSPDSSVVNVESLLATEDRK